MSEIKIKKLIGMGDFGANAYLILSDKSAVLIDAPCGADYILSCLDGRNLSAVLLTHGHIDHISASEELRLKTGCKVYISKDDKNMLTDSKACLADYFSQPFYPCSEAHTLSERNMVFGDISVSWVDTPGHTGGSVCYVFDDVIFTGDTLFKESIGRDFGGGKYHMIIDSIVKLYKLKGNYRVLPGHGMETDLYSELIYNPFLSGIKDEITK